MDDYTHNIRGAYSKTTIVVIQRHWRTCLVMSILEIIHTNIGPCPLLTPDERNEGANSKKGASRQCTMQPMILVEQSVSITPIPYRKPDNILPIDLNQVMVDKNSIPCRGRFLDNLLNLSLLVDKANMV